MRANTDSYVVSLGTGQIISMSGQSADGEFVAGKLSKSKTAEFREQFFYGLSASSVYINSYAGVGHQSLFSTSVSPYLAVQVPTKTGSYVAQYTAVVNPNDTNSGDPQAFHTATLKADGAFSRRWSWELTETGSYGSENARFQAPLTFVVIQTTPVANASAALLLPTKNVSFAEGAARAAYQLSSRDAVGFTLTHTYTGIEGDPTSVTSTGSHSNSVGAKIDYARTVSSRVSLKAYGTSDRVLNGPACNSYGGGLGVSVKLTHAVGFDVQGGPQRNSVACGGQQSANFSGNVVGTFRNGDRIYASANRVFTSAFRVDGYWEDNATVGYAKTIKRLTLITDAGVIRGDLLTGNTPIPGLFHLAAHAAQVIECIRGLCGLQDFPRQWRSTGGGQRQLRRGFTGLLSSQYSLLNGLKTGKSGEEQMNPGTNNGIMDQAAALWATVKHYRGLIYIGTVFFSLAGATLILLMPDHFKASTTILVDPQKIPEKYVSPTISSDPGQRLTTITQQVLSSTRLQQIIDEMHLYPELQGRSSREEIIDKMRKDITITVKQGSSSGLSAFTIEYEGSKADQVASVANQLAGSFIEWNNKNREQQAQDTTEFLDAQLKEAKENLEEQEKKVSAFKMSHLGEMPEQQQGNLQALAQLQTQFQANIDAQNRLEVERTLLTRGLDPAGTNGTVVKSTALTERGRLEAERRDLKGNLLDLQRRYTNAHPEVKDAAARLARVEEQLKALPPDPPVTADSNDNSVITVRMQLLDRETKRLAEEQNASPPKSLHIAPRWTRFRCANSRWRSWRVTTAYRKSIINRCWTRHFPPVWPRIWNAAAVRAFHHSGQGRDSGEAV